MTFWNSMAAAPKDRPILGCDGEGDEYRIFEMVWRESLGMWEDPECDGTYTPVAWAEKPAPPDARLVAEGVARGEDHRRGISKGADMTSVETVRECFSGKCESPEICECCDGCLSGTLEYIWRATEAFVEKFPPMPADEGGRIGDPTKH